MVELYKPRVEDMWFKAAMLSDARTMAYNHAWGGTIPFPQEKWAAWHDKWVANPGGVRFYRYIVADGVFVGEVAYHIDEARQLCLADVIVHAAYRGKGYGHRGLQLLCSAARANGVQTLCDEVAIDNPSLALLRKCGFREVLRTDEYVRVQRELQD